MKKTLALSLLSSVAMLGASASTWGATPAGVPDDWWTTVQESIAVSEYHVTWQQQSVLDGVQAGWHAPNRAHDLRTYFTPAGIRVVPRQALPATASPAEDQPSWEWSLVLLGYGRGTVVSPVSKATLSTHENRIEYDRGAIVEWYVNDRRGLEQGFTLSAPPEAIAGTGEATNRVPQPFVALRLGGNLSPIVSADGQAIDFVSPGGVRLVRYSKLRVTDARDTELSAWMEGSAEAGVPGIRIVFDDRDALYPVTIDALATTPAWSGEGDQAGAQFGVSVSTAGDVNGDGYSDVIVGAYLYDNGQTDEGRAFVYHGSSSGLSSTPAWTTEGNQIGASYGHAVSTAGDVNGDGLSDVIIGAYTADGGELDEGRAYVFHGFPAGLRSAPDWRTESDQPNANYGFSVAAAGDVNGDGYGDVIVGAYLYDGAEADDEGRVYVYHGSPSGLSLVEAWAVESEQGGSRLGQSVSTAGDVNGDGYADVIVGEPLRLNGQDEEGRAYVYHGSPHGLGEIPGWTVESDQVNARLGTSVSTAGDVNGDGFADVIVGAFLYDGGETDEGRALVYHGSPTGLAVTPAWTADGNQPFARLGAAVSTAGDVNGDGYADVIVGAYLHDNVETNDGRVYLFRGSASGLSTTAIWTGEGSQPHSRYGFAVSTAGDVNGDGFADTIVGAFLNDNGDTDEGQAFVYLGSPAGLSSVTGWNAEGTQFAGFLGLSVSTAGDVNGDGFADVIVGAPGYDNGEDDEGRAYVYHGSSSGLSDNEDWIAESNLEDSSFGRSVSTAGDVNGDGYADVIVGAMSYTNGQSGEGRAYVYHGSPSGLSAFEAWTVESNQQFAGFGRSVSTAGDVNGDGYGDVIVGAPGASGSGVMGRVYVYHGSSTGLGTVEASSLAAPVEETFGISVSTAGDVNGDGYSDVIAGGPTSAVAYQGSPTGLVSVEAWIVSHTPSNTAVSTAGDVNGDGYADVVVGVRPFTFQGPPEHNGRAYVYHGSASGLSSVEAWTAELDPDDVVPYYMPVSTAGDVNGDGYADVIVGGTGAERVSVYHGSSTGLNVIEAWAVVGSQPDAQFGRSVSAAGDVNGDGFADVIVGDPGFDGSSLGLGKVSLYYGGGGIGLALKPQQLGQDNLVPIAPGGLSRAVDSFRLGARGQSPFGRGRVKLEWEIKTLGQAFDGSGTGQSDWFDSRTIGATINERISDLAPGPHHWRMRLLYDPVTSPFQHRSRWFTVPWNGWQETDLIIGTLATMRLGAVPDGHEIMGQPLTVAIDEHGDLVLNWGESCTGNETDYAVYVGTLGDFTSHEPCTCSTAGQTTFNYPPDPVDEYYLVVPVNQVGQREGGYGLDSNGTPRPASFGACFRTGIPAACTAP